MTFEGRAVRPGDVAFGSDGRFLDKEGRLTGLCRGGGGGGAGAAGADAALYLVPLSQLSLVSDSCFVTHSGAGNELIFFEVAEPLLWQSAFKCERRKLLAGEGG
jgi:hypothetical protein